MAVDHEMEVGSSRIAVPAQNLIVGKKLPFDVYVQVNGGFKVLFAKGTEVNSATLTEQGISEVYISVLTEALDEYLYGKQPETKGPLKITPVLFEEYCKHKEQYFHIERKLLVAGTKINFSVFVMNLMAITHLVEAEEYTPGKLDKAILETPGDLLIKNEDIPLYRAYVNSILESDKTESFIKTTAIKENMKIVVKALFNDTKSGDKMLELQHIVGKMVDCFLANNSIAIDMLSLMSCDYYTYTHSANVAVLSIGLGAELNMNRSDIEALGVGALLHDIGKSVIPNYILNKQGKLNYAEYTLMQSHVEAGKHILETNSYISAKSLYAISQHHEKMSGAGYPLHLSGSKIDPFGKITAIADCFDALTTHRPYKLAHAPFHALALITKEKGNYDPNFLMPFIKMLAKK